MDLPNWFRQLPMGRAVIEQADAEVAATREQHIAAIADLTARREKIAPGLSKAVEAANDTVLAAQGKLDEAKRKLAQAVANRTNEMYRFESAISRHEIELANTADDSINEFRRELEAELQRTMKAGYDVIEGKEFVRGMPARIATSNSAAVSARIRRLVEAITTDWPRLRMLPAGESADAMQAIRDSLPATHEVWDDPALARRLASPRVVAAAEDMSV